MKIAVRYSQEDHDILPIWQRYYNVSETTLEPVLVIKSGTIIPSRWRHKFLIHDGPVHQLYEKLEGPVLVLTPRCLILTNIDYFENSPVPLALFGLPTDIYSDCLLLNKDISEYCLDEDDELLRLVTLVVQLQGAVLANGYHCVDYKQAKNIDQKMVIFRSNEDLAEFKL